VAAGSNRPRGEVGAVLPVARIPRRPRLPVLPGCHRGCCWGPSRIRRKASGRFSAPMSRRR